MLGLGIRGGRYPPLAGAKKVNRKKSIKRKVIMDALLTELNDLNTSNSVPDNEEVVLNNLQNSPVRSLVKRIELIASQVLIDEEGQNLWELHDTMAAAGFPVSCGEKDSFGWLTGVIHTKKGKIIYG